MSNSSDIGHEAIHLLFSANRWEQKKAILNTLSEGTTIICDRYAYSGVAFSAAKGLDFEWCKSPDKWLPRPDIVLMFDISAQEIMKWPGFGDEWYEKPEFQDKVFK